jgi:integrase
LLDAAGICNGSRVLDVATGAGYVAGAAAKRGLMLLGSIFRRHRFEWHARDIPPSGSSKLMRKHRNPVTVERGAVKRAREGTGRTRILTADEEQRLFEAAQRSTWPMMHVFVLMALTTATCRSEILFLRWSMVNLEDGLALVPKTKNGEIRQLPLVPQVRKVLSEIAKTKPKPEAFVFADPDDDSRPLRSFDELWTQCRKDVGLYRDRPDPMDQVVLHTTRHTGATKMVKAGKNAFQIARVTGLKTLSVLQKYTHLAGQEAIDLANEVLANVGTEKP